MTYEQAITAVKGGTRVKRSGWSGHYLERKVLDNSDIEIDTVFVRTTKAPYVATEDDMTTDDWTTA